MALAPFALFLLCHLQQAEPVQADNTVESDLLQLAHAELIAAVDLPTVKSRRDRARELAKDDRWSIDDWQQVCANFGTFEQWGVGVSTHLVDLPVGDQVEETDIHVFVPESYRASAPHSMLLVLHGAGGSGEAALRVWQQVAIDQDLILVAPTESGANFGYAFVERERQNILAVLRWARRQLNIDENRIHLTGISRGGHACWDLARHPNAWASVIPCIGGPALSIPEGRNNIRLAVNFAHIPVVILQGMGDQDKMLLNQQLAMERVERVGGQIERVEFPDLGHSFKLDTYDWARHFKDAVRPSPPRKLALASAREDEGALAWLEIVKLGRDAKEKFQPRVDPNKWNAWSHAQKARFLQGQVDERTGLIEAEWTEEGILHLEVQNVSKLALLLTTEMLGDKGQARAHWKKKRTKKMKPSSKVLLEHFVERFDRTFLPVARWELR